MKTYQYFATVLAQLLGNETAVRLTVKGYMLYPLNTSVNPPKATT